MLKLFLYGIFALLEGNGVNQEGCPSFAQKRVGPGSKLPL
jgi:hypothetical protein